MPGPKVIEPTPTTATIHAMTHDGRGIAQIQGKTTFIEGALPGEEVLFTYTSRKGKFDEGRTLEVLKASPDRVEPLCQHFNVCGGCSLQHMNSSAQIQMKQQLILDQLQHFGKIQPDTVLPPLTGPQWGYRRKGRLSVKYVGKKNAVLVGFHEKNGRYIADIKRCEILQPPLDSLITPLKELIQNLKSYQHIPQLEVAVGDQATAIIFRHLVPLASEDIEQLIAFGKQHQLHIYLQPKGPQSIHLIWPENLASEFLQYSISDPAINLEFKPTDFVQINKVINQQMIKRALELLALEAADCVLDLFCGLGNFTLPIARQCAEVIGVEGDADLIARATENAQKNHLNNARFFQQNLEGDFNFENWTQRKFTKVLLDPPRVGALHAIQQIAKLKPQRIVYVSCNPATLARDAGELINHGYRLTKVGMMDMFPHTHHAEAIGLFSPLRKLSR